MFYIFKIQTYKLVTCTNYSQNIHVFSNHLCQGFPHHSDFYAQFNMSSFVLLLFFNRIDYDNYIIHSTILHDVQPYCKSY